VSSHMRAREGLKRILQILIVGLIFFFLIRTVYQNWVQVSQHEWSIDYVPLAVSFIVLLCGFSLMVGIWRHILKKLGSPLQFKTSWRVWWFSNMGRYLPGKVWQIVGMVYLCGKESVPKDTSLTSIVIAQAVSILSAFLLMGSYVLFASSENVPQGAYLLLVLIPVGLVAIHPSILRRLINMVLRKLRREPIELSVTLNDVVSLFVLYLIGWGIYGVAFYFFVNSVHDLSITLIPHVICIFAVADVFGLLCFVVPGGLGVREGLLATLLGTYIPLPVATVVALLYRIWFTAAELICLGFALKR